MNAEYEKIETQVEGMSEEELNSITGGSVFGKIGWINGRMPIIVGPDGKCPMCDPSKWNWKKFF